MSVKISILFVSVTLGVVVSGASLAVELANKESALDTLATRAEVDYSSRCSTLATCGDSKSVPACGNSFPSGSGFHCNATFGVDATLCGTDCGLIRSMDNTVVRFPPGVDFNDAETQAFVCSSRKMDNEFKDAVDNGPLQAWTYVGHHSGSIRIFPGSPQGRDTGTDGTCSTYDARLRPWFIAASSGPKDIVIIIDRSRSMQALNNLLEPNGQTRLGAVRSAVNAVLGTLTPNDHVNVVAFGSQATVIGSPSTSLFRATTDAVKSLKDDVDVITVQGDTVMAPAFTKAFDLFAASATTDSSSGCTRILLFLTDGTATDNPDAAVAQTTVLNAITAGQAKIPGNPAHIFTYSMSSDADHTLPKAIACANMGIWATISDGEDPLTQMRGYYQFLATGIVSTQVRWTAPYLDDFGLGQMVTAARPIYDHSNNIPLMVGVVGADITIAELQTSGSNYNTIVNELIKRSSVCSNVNLSQCDLQHLRGSGNECPAPAPTLTNCSSERAVTTTCTSVGKTLNDYLIESLSTTTRMAKTGPAELSAVACCAATGICGGASSSSEDDANTAVIVGAVVGTLVVVVIIAVIIGCCMTGGSAPARNHTTNHHQNDRDPVLVQPVQQPQQPQYPQYPAHGGASFGHGGGASFGHGGGTPPPHHNDGSQNFPPPPSYEESNNHGGRRNV